VQGDRIERNLCGVLETLIQAKYSKSRRGLLEDANLNENADWLSGQKQPDIDQLVPKVETVMKAYSICKDRLAKVQAMLGQYFERDAPLGGDDSIGNGSLWPVVRQLRGYPLPAK
jgi:hypothetical protein